MDEMQQQRARRDFLRAAGLGGVTLVVAACGGGVERAGLAPTLPSAPGAPAPVVVGPGGSLTFDFASEPDVLNFAFVLEQLGAAYYTQATSAPNFAGTFAPNEQRVLQDLRDHEIVHREFFAAALGQARIPNLTFDFSSVNFGNRVQVLETARALEDMCVGALNGSARYIQTPANLTVAGKLVSLEARQAATLRDLLNPRSGGANGFAPNAYDAPLTPQQVVAAGDPFIVESLIVTNT